MKHFPFRVAALLALSGFASGISAVPLHFHPNEELQLLRLFPHEGDVVATWKTGIAQIDSATLEITDVDATPYFIWPMPVAGSEEFFYARLGNSSDHLKALRNLATTELTPQIDAQVYAGAGGNIFYTTFQPGLDLFTSDGTTAGTAELFDLDPNWSYPCNILCPPGVNSPTLIQAAANGRVYLIVLQGDDFHGFRNELWTRDPATGPPPAPEPGRRRLAVLDEEPLLSYATRDGRLFYLIQEPGTSYYALWVSDGSVEGTVKIKTFPGAVYTGNGPAIHHPVEMDSVLYFLVERAAHRELWRSNGSEEGTALVRDFGIGQKIGDLWQNGSRLYLPVDAEGLGEELWTSNGSFSPNGTHLVADIGPGLSGAKPRAFAPLPDGRFAISLDDGIHGPEPWVSDGTAAGTTLIADALEGPGGSDPVDLVAAGQRLFFVGTAAGGQRGPGYVELPPMPPACAPEKLCLQDGRFEVTITWTTATQSGQAQRAIASDSAGVFTFFGAYSPDNWEVMVKVLDGCAINQRFWVFAAAATDVQYEIRVKDLDSQLEKVYTHAGGSPAPALADIDAFATCEP